MRMEILLGLKDVDILSVRRPSGYLAECPGLAVQIVGQGHFISFIGNGELHESEIHSLGTNDK